MSAKKVTKKQRQQRTSKHRNKVTSVKTQRKKLAADISKHAQGNGAIFQQSTWQDLETVKNNVSNLIMRLTVDTDLLTSQVPIQKELTPNETEQTPEEYEISNKYMECLGLFNQRLQDAAKQHREVTDKWCVREGVVSAEDMEEFTDIFMQYDAVLNYVQNNIVPLFWAITEVVTNTKAVKLGDALKQKAAKDKLKAEEEAEFTEILETTEDK